MTQGDRFATSGGPTQTESDGCAYNRRMPLRRDAMCCCLLLMSGCPAPGEPAAADSGPAARPGTTTVVRPTLPDGPTHYAISTPPAANAACEPLPKGGATGYAALASAARRLSCEPALYFLTAEALRTELALPAEYTVEFAGASSVSIRFPKGKATELAAALGVTSAVAARRNAGAWGWRIWNMVTDPKTGTLERWAPGVLNIGVDVDAVGIGDEIPSIPLDQSTLHGHLSVTMPESVLPLADDAAAAAALIAGLQMIAGDERRLGDEPRDVAEFAGLANERFRLSRRSSSTANQRVDGIDVWTARTRIAAGPVIEALGVPGTIRHSSSHDSDAYLLYDGDASTFAWNGLTIELSFDQRDGTPAPGPHGAYVLAGVTLMP